MKTYFPNDKLKDLLLIAHIQELKNDYAAYEYLGGLLHKYKEWATDRKAKIALIEIATGDKIEKVLSE